ncbi:lipoate--protein ligase [Thermohalobacter berrensis]|uniref:lipoate--protein ligase n=1 Tax=Thermohalobacter berrensis TaxID=99594 RepID=A0A419SV79_9FIRM|nr:lipoate--protein ligase [Thermohalobacter berrensis]RKD29138.1 lipoate--protein ligase [Thermohalobacter berrensis]
MIYIYNDSTNPYFNLATEEYILKEFKEDCFMLWRNKPCIVVGKNQNTLSEINLDYVKEHNIPVVRRLSGGGAVFHDLGNLNFTFIFNDSTGNSFSNFKKFTQPIIDVLKKLSVNAEFSGRNDLTIDGKKFSGNAQYHYKNRILHHGTLLFSANMTDLTAALKVKPSKFKDKGVKSIKSRVTNITKHLKEPLTILEFKDLIMEHIKNTYGGENLYSFTESDIAKINKLVKEKYETWDWNFGSSPKYSFKKEMRYGGGTVEINLNVEKGLIKDVKIFGDFFGKYDISHIENALKGVKHSEDEIYKTLSFFDINNYFSNISLKELIKCLF